jgi:hypothetical protein
MSIKKVTFAGTSGSVEVEVTDGSTVREVLLDALQELAREAGNFDPSSINIDRLAPVVDGASAQLDDVVVPAAQRVSAAPRVNNG